MIIQTQSNYHLILEKKSGEGESINPPNTFLLDSRQTNILISFVNARTWGNRKRGMRS